MESLSKKSSAQLLPSQFPNFDNLNQSISNHGPQEFIRKLSINDLDINSAGLQSK